MVPPAAGRTHLSRTQLGRTRGARALVAATVAGVAVASCTLAVVSAATTPAIALAEPPRGGYPPDPPSTPSTRQWFFDVRVDRGKVSIERVRSHTGKVAEPTARVMGRYALELWVGTELLDRIRFNVPLGADLPREDDGRPFRRPSFDKVTTRFAVKMADHPRAAFVKLVDRATGAETKFLWPPRGEVLEPFTPPPATSGSARRPPPARDAGTTPPPPDAGTPPPPDAGTPPPPRDGGPPPPPRDGG